MLILTRKSGEQIKIGEDIILHVFEISKGSVRLGIEAPQSIPIYRYEVYEKIQEENLRASQGALADIDDAVKLLREKALKEQPREDQE